MDDSTSPSLSECSIYYCGEAESETVIYSNSVLHGSSLEHICKYKIAGSFGMLGIHGINFMFYQLAAEHVCECILLLLAFLFILLYALHRDSARLASVGTALESI